MTTNMSGAGEYFAQPALAMSFIPVVEAHKRLNGIGVAATMNQNIGVVEHKVEEDNDLIFTKLLSAGCRMDGDDTLMSSEERLIIFSKKKPYTTPRSVEVVYH